MGDSPTLTPNSVLVCHWCNDIGIAKVIEGANVGISIPTNAIVSQSGRYLWRHESGMGTVMFFNDGQDRAVLVLDAQYRARMLTMTSDYYTDKSLPNYTQTGYINGGSSTTSPSACASLTDDTLNSLWVNSIDTNTSKYNTDVWLTQPDCEAATHCRSIVVNGVGCDIPNIQTLMRIYCEGVLLDELDPTVSSRPGLKLSDWFNGWVAFSSTEYDSCGSLAVGWNGMCSNTDFGEDDYGICPVLEL